LFWGFALLFLFGNFLAESRSGTIGFAVTLALLMALSIKQGKMMRLVTVALCLFLLMFWIPESYWQRMQTIPVVGKSANESSAAELDVREWMYPRGFELFLERPLMGWGFGSFPTVNGSYSTWAMHSWYLAMLCEQGVFGFLIYTAFFFSVGVSLWKCRSGNLSRGHLSITASLLGITAIGLAVCGAFAPVPYDKTIFVVAGLSVGLSRLNTLKQQGNY
jgi:O-antigen ligase